MSSEVIRVAREDDVTTIILNRPESGNALNAPMANQLMQQVVLAAEDPTVRCVILTGAGTKFCVGGDVNAFAEGNPAVAVSQITAPLHAAIHRLATMSKPLVVGVNGPAAGAGFGLAMLGDVVVADALAHFTSAYTAIGLSPDAGTS